jgi:hypothetical protein
MVKTTRVMVMVTRVADNKKGNGKGGKGSKVYGDSNEEGKGKGCQSDGDGN